MKTVTVANQKGGVGKSTLSVHLAWHAAEHGQRVLLVDLDGQANTTRTFAPNVPLGVSAAGLFAERFDGEPLRTIDNVDLIHADAAVNDIEGLPLECIQFPARHLAMYADHYDLCVIDTPPSLGRRLLAALIASTGVVAPIELSGYSMQGITDLLGTFNTVKRRWNPGIKILGIQVNKFNARSKQQQALLAELRAQLGPIVLSDVLGNRTAVADAIDNFKPVWSYGRGFSGQTARREMRAAITTLIKRLSDDG